MIRSEVYSSSTIAHQIGRQCSIDCSVDANPQVRFGSSLEVTACSSALGDGMRSVVNLHLGQVKISVGVNKYC